MEADANSTHPRNGIPQPRKRSLSISTTPHLDAWLHPGLKARLKMLMRFAMCVALYWILNLEFGVWRPRNPWFQTCVSGNSQFQNYGFSFRWGSDSSLGFTNEFHESISLFVQMRDLYRPFCDTRLSALAKIIDIPNSDDKGKHPAYSSVSEIRLGVIGPEKVYFYQHCYWMSIHRQRLLLNRAKRSTRNPDTFEDMSFHEELAILPAYLSNAKAS